MESSKGLPPKPAEAPLHESARVRADRAELIERIMRALPTDGFLEVPGGNFFFHRESTPSEPLHAVSSPAVCFMAQGAKLLHLGEATYRYDPFHYLLITAELPMSSEIVRASTAEPFLSMVLRLDPTLVGQVIMEFDAGRDEGEASSLALDVSPLNEDLLDAALRLVRLLDDPAGAQVLAPLITREIVYRLLRGEQGARLRQLAALGGARSQLASALRRLHTEFDRPLPVEELAGEAGLSPSRFHHHFRTTTGLSPLQFQKHLRLQAARRLLLGEVTDAATAAYRVGYASASHFGRDYKRYFGVSPGREIERVRASVGAVSDPH